MRSSLPATCYALKRTGRWRRRRFLDAEAAATAAATATAAARKPPLLRLLEERL